MPPSDSRPSELESDSQSARPSTHYVSEPQISVSDPCCSNRQDLGNPVTPSSRRTRRGGRCAEDSLGGAGDVGAIELDLATPIVERHRRQAGLHGSTASDL